MEIVLYFVNAGFSMVVLGLTSSVATFRYRDQFKLSRNPAGGRVFEKKVPYLSKRPNDADFSCQVIKPKLT